VNLGCIVHNHREKLAKEFVLNKLMLRDAQSGPTVGFSRGEAKRNASRLERGVSPLFVRAFYGSEG
jgi:hypothetical protein